MAETYQTSPEDGGGGTKEKAQEAAGQAKEKASEAAGQAKNRLATEVDTRSTQAGEQLRTTADDVRSVAGELRGKGKDKPAELAEKAAERVQRVGDYLHRSDGDRLLSDVEDFARSKPWAVAAGGLALGFAASRFLKASSARRYEARGVDRTYNGGAPPVGYSPAVDPVSTDPARPTVPARPTDPARPAEPLPPTDPLRSGVVH
jgi:hypothetical protein